MPVNAPILLSVAEAAKFLGLSTRTIRRAISQNAVTYIVVKDRYRITLPSLLRWALGTPNAKKKLETAGFGSFVASWKPLAEPKEKKKKTP